MQARWSNSKWDLLSIQCVVYKPVLSAFPYACLTGIPIEKRCRICDVYTQKHDVDLADVLYHRIQLRRSATFSVHDVEVGISIRCRGSQRTTSDVLYRAQGRYGLGGWRIGLASCFRSLLVLIVSTGAAVVMKL